MIKYIAKRILVLGVAFGLNATSLFAQTYDVNINAHSHNDYEQKLPFYTAYANHFASIEIDVFLKDNELYVAHNREDINANRTIESLYLEPLLKAIKLNGGKVYPDRGQLQFLIDLKTDGEATLKVLENKLKPIRNYFDVKNNPNAVRLVLSGNMPILSYYKNFDDIFYFDGRPGMNYNLDELKRVPFFSASFKQFSKWNGLGRMVHQEQDKLQFFVDSVHRLGKKVRFWGNPDTKTSWQTFIKLGVDYLNTDSPMQMAEFLDNYKTSSYISAIAPSKSYHPTYKNDGAKTKPKNVILLISDGAGFSQLWAAATANGGDLNAMGFKHIGFSNTVPADNYNTDSAAGATAMSTGEKTNNRAIGTDSLGKTIPNITERLSAKGIRCGVVSNDNLLGATPASFYGHATDRDFDDILVSSLLNSPVALLVGEYSEAFKPQLKALGEKGFKVINGINNINPNNKKVICFDKDRSAENFRLIESAFDKSVAFLTKDNNKGFFLMIEGADIDHGGHANQIKQCIDEYRSFDKVIGKALEFADKDGETLVLVTSDHETGGLIILDGNYKTGTVVGTFTTHDHTGLPVPLLSYGPGATDFTGFIQNADIPKKILKLLD
jgi:alkaline phosphatase